MDSLSVREFLDYKLDYDIVFSPTQLETEKKLFISKVFLGQDERYRLRKQVMLAIHGYIPNDINVYHIVDIIKKHTAINNEKALIEDLEQYFNRDDDSAVVRQNAAQREIDLDELIVPENITLRDSVDSWEEAIRISADPLIKKGKILPEYVHAMIHHSNDDPYIVIGTNIAIPHAAPEDGVNEVGMTLLRLKDGVQYSQDYKINLIFVIAAVDKQQHIHALMQLMNLAGSEEDTNKIINASSIEEVHEIIKFYSSDRSL